MVILELMKKRYNQGLEPNLFFYRDQQKHEVDVIYKKATDLIPIEIKSSKTFSKKFYKEIDYFSSLFPDHCNSGYIVYAGEQTQAIGWRNLVNFCDTDKLIRLR